MKKAKYLFILAAAALITALASCGGSAPEKAEVAVAVAAETDASEQNADADSSENETASAQEADARTEEAPPVVSPAQAIFTRELSVHIIDVGQADSILIKLPNEQNILIDGGNTADAGAVKSYLKAQNVTVIDYLIATHPDEDHIGGLSEIIDDTNIGAVYMPLVGHTTKAFERLLTSISNKELQIDQAQSGKNVLSVPGLQVDIIAPERNDYSDLNDFSAVVKLDYGAASFLFMGDAEKQSEADIKADPSADVIKIGHHGSDTSTSAEFLKRVSPAYAVISVGDNSYGHPSGEVLAALDNAGVSVYRTDLQGTIVFVSDGKTITPNQPPAPYQPQAPPLAAGGASAGAGGNNNNSADSDLTPAPSNDPTVYRTNTGGKYHIDGCRHIAKSKIEMKLSEAKAAGLTPCKVCGPPA